ncbi:hypothetical protein [Saccharopolyspora cebuensis]|uniref:hypothetical protein n=1 Tax=Saccharopolyspora cebuensis TaxID=418759 RepID=UPI003372AC42
MPQTKVKAELRDIERQRRHLNQRLDTASADLTDAARLIDVSLKLLERPEQLYRRCNDEQRRLLNQAIFHNIYIEDEEVTDHDLQEPFSQLHAIQQLTNSKKPKPHKEPKPHNEPKSHNERKPHTEGDHRTVGAYGGSAPVKKSRQREKGPDKVGPLEHAERGRWGTLLEHRRPGQSTGRAPREASQPRYTRAPVDQARLPRPRPTTRAPIKSSN